MNLIKLLKKYLLNSECDMDKTWKKFERKIAEELTLLGDDAERIPVTGRVRGHAADIKSNVFSIECKYRKEIPKWIKNAMDQAVKSSDGVKTPIVFLKERSAIIDDTLVILRLGDLKKEIRNGQRDI